MSAVIANRDASGRFASSRPAADDGATGEFPSQGADIQGTGRANWRETTFEGIRQQIREHERKRYRTPEARREARLSLALKLDLLVKQRSDLYAQRDQARADRREDRADRELAQRDELIAELRRLDALPHDTGAILGEVLAPTTATAPEALAAPTEGSEAAS
jgi:hypothetical protein